MFSLTSVPSSFTRSELFTAAALRSTLGISGSFTTGSGLGTGRPSDFATRSRLSAAITVGRCTGAGPDDLPVGSGSSAASVNAFAVRVTSHATPKMNRRWMTQKCRLKRTSTTGPNSKPGAMDSPVFP